MLPTGLTMCGVIGLICQHHRDDLGRIAADLLKTLEYRGYDSTGAAIQGEGTEVDLRKGVGAPSVLVHRLGIVDLPGRILCGQVRWATFGAVTETNAQPHVVRCKRYLYGAHNGNVTNCDDLAAWLEGEGHRVLSSNDGEMVVHTVEHYFGLEMDAEGAARELDHEVRRAAMRRAIVRAAARLEGSYAAVIVDPESRTLWSIKQGSSLYFGVGRDEKGGELSIASSDLSSVLMLTRMVVPIVEGDFVEHRDGSYQVYRVKAGGGLEAGAAVDRPAVRSRLRAKDTALRAPFSTFMEQEIADQEPVLRRLFTLFEGGSEGAKAFGPLLDGLTVDEARSLAATLDTLRDAPSDEALGQRFFEASEHLAARLERVPASLGERSGGTESLISSEAGLLGDLLEVARGPRDVVAVRLFDALLEREEVVELDQSLERFVELCLETEARRGRVFVLSCGSSFHAAKAAALFFNELARTDVLPLLPGELRGQHLQSLRDGDLCVAVSQSGETKDLIDALNQIAATGKAIAKVAVVNNVSSTLAQEKAELVLPIRCGPEVAVPATKSFTAQVALFYLMALRVAEARAERLPPGAEREAIAARAKARREGLARLPALLAETIAATRDAVAEAAELLYLAPNIHLLATRMTAVAREGALKVREVVLNHTEGYEASEFKHGPNTILGTNTVYGPKEVQGFASGLAELIGALAEEATARGMSPEATGQLLQAAARAPFAPEVAGELSPEARALLERHLARGRLFESLYRDSPLIYVTGPSEQDVALTISQINTHKIRGASTLVIAEEHPGLRQAATKPPADNPEYRSAYVVLPKTGDTLLTVFTATVVLQRLALEMSVRKAAHLDRIGLPDHGVHPDVPKNVSKSITVD